MYLDTSPPINIGGVSKKSGTHLIEFPDKVFLQLFGKAGTTRKVKNLPLIIPRLLCPWKTS